MIQILPLANILHEEVLLEDDFNNKFEGWEIVEDEDEKSFIKDSHYWMENKSNNRWMFYHKKLPVKKQDNFIIKAEIELLQSSRGYGQYGLVWGFDKEHNELNKFVVSSDHDDYTIAKFQKNHEFTTHRFNRNYEKHPFEDNKQFFSIVKLEDYYYFFLNRFDRYSKIIISFPFYLFLKNLICMVSSIINKKVTIPIILNTRSKFFDK